LARESFKEQMVIIIICFYLSFLFLCSCSFINPNHTKTHFSFFYLLLTSTLLYSIIKKTQIPSSSSQWSSHITTSIPSLFFSQHNTTQHKNTIFLCENTHKQHDTRSHKSETCLTDLFDKLKKNRSMVSDFCSNTRRGCCKQTLNRIFWHGGDVFRCGGRRSKLIQTWFYLVDFVGNTKESIFMVVICRKTICGGRDLTTNMAFENSENISNQKINLRMRYRRKRW